MGKRRTYNRIKKITSGIYRYFWILIVVPVWEVFKNIIEWAWGEYASKLLGDKVVNVMQSMFDRIGDLVPKFGLWISNHPGSTSAIWFFLVLSIVLIMIYRDTRDPHGINVDRTVLLVVSGTYRDSGFAIINNSGNDLQSCTLYVSSIDNHKIDKKYRNDYLQWGERSDNTYSEDDISIEIPQTEQGYMYINQIKHWIHNTDKEKFYGLHDVELIFHANTKVNESIPFMPIYCTVDVGQMEVNGFTDERLLLVKVET
jgi:hypothetical protein